MVDTNDTASVAYHSKALGYVHLHLIPLGLLLQPPMRRRVPVIKLGQPVVDGLEGPLEIPVTQNRGSLTIIAIDTVQYPPPRPRL